MLRARRQGSRSSPPSPASSMDTRPGAERTAELITLYDFISVRFCLIATLFSFFLRLRLGITNIMLVWTTHLSITRLQSHRFYKVKRHAKTTDGQLLIPLSNTDINSVIEAKSLARLLSAGSSFARTKSSSIFMVDFRFDRTLLQHIR